MCARAHIDAQMAGALKIARVMAPAVNSDSEDDTESPDSAAPGMSLGGRLNFHPCRSDGAAKGMRYCGRRRPMGIQYLGRYLKCDARQAAAHFRRTRISARGLAYMGA